MNLMICTRPELGFAVGRLSQYCEEPLRCHWNAVKRVYSYVKGTQNMGIVYDAKSEASSDVPIVGYCDSDWAGCNESSQSTEAYVFLLTGGAISWRSKKQSIVALSSCEAEYISACTAAKEAIWLSNVLQTTVGTEKPLSWTIKVPSSQHRTCLLMLAIKTLTFVTTLCVKLLQRSCFGFFCIVLHRIRLLLS